jgi:hypothetical protein
MNLREFRPTLWLTELVLDDFDVRGAVIVGQERVLVWDTLSHLSTMECSTCDSQLVGKLHQFSQQAMLTTYRVGILTPRPSPMSR